MSRTENFSKPQHDANFKCSALEFKNSDHQDYGVITEIVGKNERGIFQEKVPLSLFDF